MVAALVSVWTISIPQVGATSSFGFQSTVCWLALLLMLSAILVRGLPLSTGFLLAAEVTLVGWYGWSMWLATTPAYTSRYDFVGTDLVGPAWYAAGLGLLFTAAVVAGRFREAVDRPGAETWWLAAVPGYGLARLGRNPRGLTWTALLGAALLLASVASPISPLFQPLNGYDSLPEAVPTRGPTWILLGTAVLIAVLSVLDTVRVKRRLAQR